MEELFSEVLVPVSPGIFRELLVVKASGDVSDVFSLRNLSFLTVGMAVDIGFDKTAQRVVDNVEGHCMVFPAVLNLESRTEIIQ